MKDQMLVKRCKEKIVDRKQRSSRQRIGLSNGVFIHFQFQFQFISSKKAVRAMMVTRWITHMAQPWTDARARGVKMSRA